MNFWKIGALIILIGCQGCRKTPNGSSMDRTQALKISDSFVFAMQANHVDDALGMMEPELLQTLGRSRAESLAHGVFDYCGHPEDLKLIRDETGIALYADGRTK